MDRNDILSEIDTYSMAQTTVMTPSQMSADSRFATVAGSDVLPQTDVSTAVETREKYEVMQEINKNIEDMDFFLNRIANLRYNVALVGYFMARQWYKGGNVGP